MSAYTTDPERLLRSLAGMQRALGDAERDVRRRLGLGGRDLDLVRLLLDAEEVRHAVTPSEVARTLDASSAAATAIIDRLENTGLLRRAAHPSDRRSIVLEPTIPADSPVRKVLRAAHEHQLEAAASLSDVERDALARALDGFVAALNEGAVDDDDPAGGGRPRR